jgi:hypothetical protein
VHGDLGHDWLPEVAAVEEGLQGAHRVVVPHVLVDGQDLAGPLAELDDLAGLVEVRGERLLSEDAP